MARLTKARRERIIREFISTHSGKYSPTAFLSEVEEAGPTHEAYEWFEWDNGKAAQAHRLEQAREFVRDLRVVYRVEEIGRSPVRIIERASPLLLSPLSGRLEGGGYILVDETNPNHRAELAIQAARDLTAWLSRYRSAVLAVAGSTDRVDILINALANQEGRDAA